VPAGEPVDVEVRDKGGERLLKKRYITNRYGAFFGQIDLLREAAIAHEVNDDMDGELRRLLARINDMLNCRVIP